MSGALSDMVETDSPVSLPLDPSLPFLPAGLEVEVLEEGVRLSWLSPPCVKSYRARACRGGDCREVRLEEPAGLSTSLVISGLEPCLEYTLHLQAVTEGEELEAEQRNFTSKCLEHGFEPEPDQESAPQTELESELQPEPEVAKPEADAGNCASSDFGCCPNSTTPPLPL